MINIEINNCNNISFSNIHIKKRQLNICYAMNGTGKSTIARAIELFSKNENLAELKPFIGESVPSVKFSESINNVLIFNEEFVNTIVFKESEVIQNAYDVFIKTPDIEDRQNSISERLKDIHIDINSNQGINTLLYVGQTVLSKFTEKANGLKQIGLLKSLTNSENIFKLPEKIKKFQPLMNKDYNVDWVSWKNEGTKYDDNYICPFCTTDLGEEYDEEKVLFSSSYSKSNVKNIKEMLSYFDKVNEYMDSDKSEKLYQCIKEDQNVETINKWVSHFYYDLKFLVNGIKNVIDFNSFSVKSEEISKLNESLQNLKINLSDLIIFNNEKVQEIVELINHRIDLVLKEIDILKKDIGQLKSFIAYETNQAVQDINDFLNMSGINYCLEIIHESENSTRTILKYFSPDQESIQVENIKLHLSWGERNAFALVLFMHYALSQKPDLIILDDPISSFDSNKKYAIINRLFLQGTKKKSFYKETVLMLTHDFQPIIDFVKNNKPFGDYVFANFLKNKGGLITELEITENDIKSSPIILIENAKNDMLNKVHRLTSLRKLLEHIHKDQSQIIAYNLLSCLIHCEEKPKYKDKTDIIPSDITLGEKLITDYIPDFSYSIYKEQVFNKNNLVNLFLQEQNPYFQLQVFRVLIAVLGLRQKIKKSDDPLLKYIDEQFHVENDYIFYLDLNKYDIVPDFVFPKCEEFLKKENVI